MDADGEAADGEGVDTADDGAAVGAVVGAADGAGVAAGVGVGAGVAGARPVTRSRDFSSSGQGLKPFTSSVETGPMMRSVGVDSTPIFRPSWVEATISACFAGSATQDWYFASSRPRKPARPARNSALKRPWFSPSCVP
jgi:hypothetical protein